MTHHFTRLFSDHVTALSRIELRQFTNAIAKPQHGFHDRIIAPQAFRPDHPERIYLGIALDEDVKGRNHCLAEAIGDDTDAWNAVTYFTNPLVISEPSLDPATGKEVWIAPMKRVAFGLSQVFTFEFDQDNIAFFKQQLAWCRSSTGKPLDTRLGELFRRCSEWIDFEGITVAWSGNKSFHIHIAFSTAQAKAMGIVEHVRDGLKAHWKRLLETVLDVLEPGVMPDMGMDQPEKFRRIPNGSRVLSKPNILGMPAGTIVPQVTMWERFRDRAPKGAATSFFDPMLFAPSFTASSRMSKQLTFMPSSEELDYCGAKMKMIFDSAPEFAGWTTHKGELRAQFFNDIGDKKPSSYMETGYRTVNINGGNTYLTPSTATRLPKTLGEMMVDWIGELDAFNSRQRTPVEKRFTETVTDAATAKRAICTVLLDTIRENDQSFVCAPEGISKTSSLFENHHRIDLCSNFSPANRVRVLDTI